MDALKCCVVLWLLNTAAAIVITPKGDFLTNCFTDDDGGQCEYSRVKICGDYYACDMTIPFDSPIKRIGYIDDHILVAEGTRTYVIDEETHEAKLIKKVIPPWGEFIDKRGNKYYTGDGTTYVGVNETGKEIEIVTTGEYSSNQLVLDDKANRLFILTFMPGEKNLRAGYLFAVTLDPLNIVNDKIQAEKVEGDDSITAMAVQGGLQKLLLGTRTEKGGKLIRLNRLNVDPCSTKDFHKTAINEVVHEASEKLFKIFEESDVIAKKNCNALRNQLDTSSAHAFEIAQLKAELNLTTTKLNACVFRVFSLNITENGSAFGIQYGETSKSETRISCSTKSKRETDDYDEGHAHHKCIPIPQYECMKNKIKSLEKSDRELRLEILNFSRELSAFSTDPLLEARFAEYINEKAKND